MNIIDVEVILRSLKRYSEILKKMKAKYYWQDYKVHSPAPINHTEYVAWLVDESRAIRVPMAFCNQTDEFIKVNDRKERVYIASRLESIIEE